MLHALSGVLTEFSATPSFFAYMVLVMPSFLWRYRFLSMLDQNGIGSHSRKGIFRQYKENSRTSDKQTRAHASKAAARFVIISEKE